MTRSLLIVFACILGPLTATAAAAAPFLDPGKLRLASANVLVLDAQDGRRMYAKAADAVTPIASLTKLMTAYVAFAALKQKTLKPDQVIPVSMRAWKSQGSRMFIEPRKAVTVEELMRGMIVQSGNDACLALAELVGGSVRTSTAIAVPVMPGDVIGRQVAEVIASDLRSTGMFTPLGPSGLPSYSVEEAGNPVSQRLDRCKRNPARPAMRRQVDGKRVPAVIREIP